MNFLSEGAFIAPSRALPVVRSEYIEPTPGSAEHQLVVPALAGSLSEMKRIKRVRFEGDTPCTFEVN